MNHKQEVAMSEEMLARYYELNRKKKEIEVELTELKNIFHDYFNQLLGPDQKGELVVNGYKLQRQIRKTEKFNDELTVKKLEDLNMKDLIQIIKRPDSEKIKSALTLGLISENDLKGCITTNFSPAISVRPVIPK